MEGDLTSVKSDLPRLTLQIDMMDSALSAKVVLGCENESQNKADQLLLPLSELGAVSRRQGPIRRRNDVDPDCAGKVAGVGDERSEVLTTPVVSS